MTSTVKQGALLVQIYDAFDHSKLIDIFDGVTDAARKVPNSSNSQIKAAVVHKLVYLGYRWVTIKRDHENARIAHDIGPNFEDTKPKKSGLIAMLNLDLNIVEQVFQLQKDVAAYVLQKPSAICNAIKYATPISGKYFVMWDDVQDDVKLTFTSELPGRKENIMGHRIQQLDPNTREVVTTFSSIADVVKQFNMSPKTVKSITAKDTLYKGFYWKMV